MKTVFLLEHIYEDSSWNEHYKLIGIYSDQKEAQQAIERLKTQPGFKHYPDHFVISEMPLDTDAWQEGFATAYWLELYSFIVIFANQSSLISQHRAKNLHHAIHDWITFLITEHKDLHSQIHHIETVNENLFTELHPQHHIWLGKISMADKTKASVYIVKTVSPSESD